MKLAGKKINSPNIEVIVLPRGDSEDIVFKAQAVLNRSDFDKICPTPEPPIIMKKGGVLVSDVEDKTFKDAILNHSRQYMDWLIIQALKATPELEWETVDYSDPSTWGNYRKELEDSGFSNAEQIRIINGVMNANSLNEEKIEEARKRFFMMDQQKKLGQSSQEAVQ